MLTLRFVLILALGIAFCAEAKPPRRPSLLPYVAELAPLLTCLEPMGSNEKAIEGCAHEAGIFEQRSSSAEPTTPDDFKRLIAGIWVLQNRGSSRARLKPELLSRAISYAQCVETAAYSDRDFSSKTAKGLIESERRAEVACKDHPLSLVDVRPAEATALPDISERLFARAVANMTLRYALEANGWFPTELRPCIRYLDGRPPSSGCAGRPEGRPPPPPIIAPRQ